MIITTTPTVEGKKIIEYKGIIFGEVISGVNVIRTSPLGSVISLEDALLPMKKSL